MGSGSACLCASHLLAPHAISHAHDSGHLYKPPCNHEGEATSQIQNVPRGRWNLSILKNTTTRERTIKNNQKKEWMPSPFRSLGA